MTKFSFIYIFILLISHFILLFYIFYKNWFIYKLDINIICKKYKKLLILLASLPFTFLIIKYLDLSNYIDIILKFNNYFIIFSIFCVLYRLTDTNVKFLFYDKSIYVYIYLHTISWLAHNNKTDLSIGSFITFSTINISCIFVQSLIEIFIMIYQQVFNNIKK